MSEGRQQTANVEFVIRPYRAADFERLWEIDQICFPPGIAYSQMDLTGFMAHRNAVTLVAEFADESNGVDKIAGFVLAYSSRKTGRIVTLDVVPEARRFGLGSRLMEECETRLKASGCTELTLETAVNNEAAIKLYEKLGYKILRRLPQYYYAEKLDAFLMGKRL